MNRYTSIYKEKELQRELKYYDNLNASDKRDAFRSLYLDYHNTFEELSKLDVTRQQVRTQPTSKSKSSVSPAVRTKLHSSLAASVIVLLGNVPWYLYVSTITLNAWVPVFASVEFIGIGTTILTWIIAEMDHIYRKWK